MPKGLFKRNGGSVANKPKRERKSRSWENGAYTSTVLDGRGNAVTSGSGAAVRSRDFEEPKVRANPTNVRASTKGAKPKAKAKPKPHKGGAMAGQQPVMPSVGGKSEGTLVRHAQPQGNREITRAALEVLDSKPARPRPAQPRGNREPAPKKRAPTQSEYERHRQMIRELAKKRSAARD